MYVGETRGSILFENAATRLSTNSFHDLIAGILFHGIMIDKQTFSNDDSSLKREVGGRAFY